MKVRFGGTYSVKWEGIPMGVFDVDGPYYFGVQLLDAHNLTTAVLPAHPAPDMTTGGGAEKASLAAVFAAENTVAPHWDGRNEVLLDRETNLTVASEILPGVSYRMRVFGKNLKTSDRFLVVSQGQRCSAAEGDSSSLQATAVAAANNSTTAANATTAFVPSVLLQTGYRFMVSGEYVRRR